MWEVNRVRSRSSRLCRVDWVGARVTLDGYNVFVCRRRQNLLVMHMQVNSWIMQ